MVTLVHVGGMTYYRIWIDLVLLHHIAAIAMNMDAHIHPQTHTHTYTYIHTYVYIYYTYTHTTNKQSEWQSGLRWLSVATEDELVGACSNDTVRQEAHRPANEH